MECSNDYNKAFESKTGVVAISILVILVLFAIFTSVDPAKKLSGKATNNPIELEDLQEQGNINPRKVIIKNGQKLVVF